jgi:hypothetical protein
MRPSLLLFLLLSTTWAFPFVRRSGKLFGRQEGGDGNEAGEEGGDEGGDEADEGDEGDIGGLDSSSATYGEFNSGPSSSSTGSSSSGGAESYYCGSNCTCSYSGVKTYFINGSAPLPRPVYFIATEWWVFQDEQIRRGLPGLGSQNSKHSSTCLCFSTLPRRSNNGRLPCCKRDTKRET